MFGDLVLAPQLGYFEELAGKLPHRGRKPVPLPASTRRLGVVLESSLSTAERRRERERSLQRAIDTSRQWQAVLSVDRFVETREALAAARRTECALFIAIYVLRWLYRPPSGPMVLRLGREVVAMV